MDLGSWVGDRQGVSEKYNHILWLGWDLHLLFKRDIYYWGWRPLKYKFWRKPRPVMLRRT